MSFQRYEKSTSQARRTPTPDPLVTLRVDADLFFNEPAAERWFDDAEQVAIYIDPENGRLAFEPTEDDPEAYALQRGKESGAIVSCKSPLDAIGRDPEGIESAIELPDPFENEDGLVVVEIPPVTDESDDGSRSADTPDPIYVAANWRSGAGNTFHEDPECPRLSRANVVEKDCSVLFDDANPCSFCAEDEDDEGYDGAVVLEQLLDDEDPKHLAADLDGCSTFHQVARELNVNRGAAVALAAELGLEEDLRTGKHDLAATDVRARIEEVSG